MSTGTCILDPERTPEFKRNPELEALLEEINAILEKAETMLLPAHPPRWPIIFVVGALRSGTTLMTQWLTASGLAAVPTNLLSRFYRAPILGAKIQLLLTDPRYRFRDELADIAAPSGYQSSNGKTRGMLAPNEFHYFWRRFLPDYDSICATDEQLAANVDVRMLVAELAGLADTFNKPLAIKAMALVYNLGFLNKLFDKAIFIYLHRDPIANAASVLDARRRQFGTETQWYSFRIPEYKILKDASPAEQAAGQVFAINRAIQTGLASIPASKQLSVPYERFCEAPAVFYDAIAKLLSAQGAGEADPYRGPEHFEPTRAHEPTVELEEAFFRIRRLLDRNHAESRWGVEKISNEQSDDFQSRNRQ